MVIINADHLITDDDLEVGYYLNTELQNTEKNII